MNVLKKPVHGGNVWAAAKRWGIPPEKILDYSANINPLGPSPKAVEALASMMGLLCHYPEPTGETFKGALSRYLQVPDVNLVLGNGGAELIYLTGRMFYQRRVLLLAPSFSEYGEGIDNPHMFRINLCREEDFKLPVETILQEIQQGDLLFLGNPNNPTGTLFAKKDLLDIVQAAEEAKAVVVVDEAFMDFVDGHGYSMKDEVEKYRNLIVVGSLTKHFAIPALRLGYGIAAPELAAKMEQLLPTWRVNSFALAAGEASITDQEYLKSTNKVIKEERAFLVEGLKQIKGLKVYPSAANFLLVDAGPLGLTSEDLQERLGPRGILIRKCSSFYNLSPCHFRIAVRMRSENEKFLENLQKVIEGC
ncbi:MAG: threonine-phosphate decarboxylase CobD [Bacillota bacterium]